MFQQIINGYRVTILYNSCARCDS